MRITDIPAKIPKAFAANGDKNAIPTDSTTTEDNEGVASLNRGFPPITMMERGAGGIPPDGKDMNGILFAISDVAKWVSAGMSFPFDAAFAAAIGGYPRGAIIPNSTGDGYWLNTIEQNSASPEVAGAALTGWVPDAPRGITNISGLSGTSRTLTTLEASRPRIVLTGTLTANINIIIPGWVMMWDVVNNCTGNFQVVIKTASGVGVALTQRITTTVYCYGTNVIKDIGNAASFDVVPISAGGTGATTANDARVALGLGALAVLSTASLARGGTGANDASGARTNLDVYSTGQVYTQAESDSRFNRRNSSALSSTYGRNVDGSTGFIIQVGRVTRTADLNAVTFPLAFPNTCIGVVMTKNESTSGPNSEANMAAINQAYNGFTAVMYSEERSATWVAIGY